MAQSTVEQMTKRAQALAGQTSNQASTAMAALWPGRPSRRPSPGPFSQLMASAQGLTANAQRMRRVPTSTRLAWRAGRLTGRVQGATAVAPFAARGWRLALMSRLQLQATRAQAQAMARWLPLAVAGTRMVTRMQAQRRPAQPNAGLRMPWAATPATGSAARKATEKTAQKAPSPAPPPAARTTSGQARAQARAAESAKRAQVAATKQATAQAAKAVSAKPQTPRGRNGQGARGGVLQLARSFIVGLAVGAGWAYLFAQRIGPGYQALQQNLRTRSA